MRRTIRRGSFCTLATSSREHRPHVVGVLYVAIDEVFYVTTLRTSVKARNVRDNPRVAVCIPVRRFPFVPPFHVSFQGRAELRERDDDAITALLAGGRLRGITGHGELDDPDSVFLTITPGSRVATYGLGIPIRQLIRDPVHASGSVKLR